MSALGAVAAGLLSVALVLCGVRLVRGPSLPDRAVALDTVLLCAVALTATVASVVEEATFLYALVVVSLVSFVATISVARFVTNQPPDADDA